MSRLLLIGAVAQVEVHGGPGRSQALQVCRLQVVSLSQTLEHPGKFEYARASGLEDC